MSRLMRALCVMAGLLSLSGPAYVGAEDSCTAKCDTDAEKCSVAAGRDQVKARSCDDAYDSCLDKCKKP